MNKEIFVPGTIPPSASLNADFWKPLMIGWNETAKSIATACKTIAPNDEAAVAEMRSQVRASIKSLNSARLVATKEYRNYTAHFNNQFKIIVEELTDANQHLDQLARNIITAKQEEAAAERVEREKIHSQRMTQLRSEADARMQDAETAPPAPAALPAVTSPLAQITTRVLREVIIDDVSILPRKYLTPNRPLIKTEALAGEEIPGVRIEEREVLQSTKR